MRKTHPIDAIIPGVRQRILSKVLLSPDRWWYLSDLSRQIKSTPSSLQRELASLVKANVLKQRYEGRHSYYKADEECPFYKELQGLFVKTAGLVDIIRDMLLPYEKNIQSAFIYGSIAKGKEMSASDIDVMIIGEVGFSTLALSFRNTQEMLLRPINTTLFTSLEFKHKVKAKNHFLRNVISKDKIFLVGNEENLERLIS